jgi:uncharacterized protein (DUF433 family)
MIGIAMTKHPRISIDPSVMLGKPCIRGSRITVELILQWLAAGRTPTEITEAYPHISDEDIRAALAFAAEAMASHRAVAAE